MTKLHLDVWGNGEPAVLVHGAGAYQAWEAQRDLANHYRLIIPHRRGYGLSPPPDRYDFEVDALDIIELLGRGAHLVGHSYGGVVSLLAAAKRPDLVRSLAVIEPPALGVALGQPTVDQSMVKLRTLYSNLKQITPEEFDAAWREACGFKPKPVRSMTDEYRAGVRKLMAERPPWEANIQLENLKGAPVPKLVISGKWNEVLEVVCDVLQNRLGAERAFFAGHGHAVQKAGKPFNDRLLAFWQSAAH